jgi:hypothetical protein
MTPLNVNGAAAHPGGHDSGADEDGTKQQPRRSRVSFSAAAYASLVTTVGRGAGMAAGEAERAVGVVESAAAAAATVARRALGPYASEEACLVEALRRFGDDAEAAVAATAVVAAQATAASFPARVLGNAAAAEVGLCKLKLPVA